MNKKLKIGLISIAIILPAYLGLRLYVVKKTLKEAKNKFSDNDIDAKKLLINDLLIKNGEPVTDANINKYLGYSVEELQNMISDNGELFDEGFLDALDSYLDSNSSNLTVSEYIGE